MKIKFFDNLSEDFTKLLENSDEYNVVIEVGESPLKQSFKVHSTILCYRFPQLYNELKKIPYNQYHRKIIHKPQISGKLFMIIINYIYGGFINLEKVSVQQIFDLMLVAKDFQLEELFKNIETYLIKDQRSWLSSNIFKIYSEVFRSNDFLLLQNFCNDMIAKNPEIVFRSKEFFSVEEEILVSIIKRDDLQFREVEIWEHVLRWGKARVKDLPLDPAQYTDSDFQNLKDALRNLLPYIRFFQISHGDIFNKVRPYHRILELQLWNDILSRVMVPQQPIVSNVLPPRKIISPINSKDSTRSNPRLSQSHQQRKPELQVTTRLDQSRTRISRVEPHRTHAATRPELRRVSVSRRPHSIPVDALNLERGSRRRTVNEGRPIKLYVRALYDYTASSFEEISFMEGDTIAVFRTCSDGWWEGELLNEQRRKAGIFPSNYTEVLKGLGPIPSPASSL